MGGLSFDAGGFPELFVFCAVSNYARFSVGESFALCAGGLLLVRGLIRAFREPDLYRGKIFGPILAVLGLATFGLFAFGVFYMVRQMPAAAGAPRVGEKAPEFTLPDQNGKAVSLSELYASPAKGTVLIFYRGHW